MLASALRRRALWAPGVRLLGRREDLARVAPSRPSSSSSASEPPGPDPAARMASDLTTYARGRYRSGDRAGAAGVLEHGAEQEQLVAELLKRHGWANIRCYKDYSGFPRVTSANKKETS